ncbi:MAG: DUF1501 domain-containing protein [Acidobacteriota bacterium]
MSIDRRAFLKAGALSLFTLGAGPDFLRRAALAAPPAGSAAAPIATRRKTLVTIFLRGAMDGLMAVPPLNDGLLRKHRQNLFLGAGDGLATLGQGFGLHPAFAPLLPMWRERQLAVVHSVGSPDPTRSHFDAQDYMETGTPGRKGTPSGWLNRASGLLGHEATPFRSVALASAMPRSLYGPEAALAITDLRELQVRLPGSGTTATAAGEGFEALYDRSSQDLLRATAEDSFEAVREIATSGLASYRPASGVRYPRSPLGRSLMQIAAMIKAGVGLEIAFAESGGWDTHVQQGTINGSFARRASDLANSIAAFWQDLGGLQDDVVVLTMTEFGRTVRQNGSGGTDHGHGSCLFALGHQVDGGKVHGDLPALEDRYLYEGRDLPVTTDFRSVFAGVAQAHLHLPSTGGLFPGWAGKSLELVRG